MSIKRTTNPADIIYAPQEASRIEINHLETKRTKKQFSVPLGLGSVDAIMTPGTAGDLFGILGRPGAGKTALMNAWARQRSKYLANIDSSSKRVVVYCSLEQPIEELAAFHTAAETSINSEYMKRGSLTDEQWDRVIGAATSKIELPLWFIGHSLERRKKRPLLTIDFLMEALIFMEDEYGVILDCIFLDYLQRVPFKNKERVESKIVGTTDVLNECKDGAIATGCPWIVGIQAGRQVDKYDPPIPNMDDGQWTSGVEQIVDTLLSVVRPCKYKRDGELFGKKEPVIIKGRNQMLLSILKQKTGDANIPLWIFLDPRYNQLADAELHNILGDDDET